MKDILIVLLLVAIVILTGIIDATLRLQEKRENDWTVDYLFNPTGQWCFLEQEQPLPVDCQFKNTFLGKEIE
tara:strand:- start:3099 stop:3314 length:216 start_codon:yes stop_codon:yes gene_type:complete